MPPPPPPRAENSTMRALAHWPKGLPISRMLARAHRDDTSCPRQLLRVGSATVF